MRSLIVFFGVIVFTFGAWINNCEDYIKFETDPISTKVANKDFSITLKNDGSDDCSFLVILKDKNSGECIGGKSISIDAGKEYVLDINYSGDSAFIASDKANYVAKDAQFVIASNTSFLPSILFTTGSSSAKQSVKSSDNLSMSLLLNALMYCVVNSFSIVLAFHILVFFVGYKMYDIYYYPLYI